MASNTCIFRFENHRFNAFNSLWYWRKRCFWIVNRLIFLYLKLLLRSLWWHQLLRKQSSEFSLLGLTKATQLLCLICGILGQTTIAENFCVLSTSSWKSLWRHLYLLIYLPSLSRHLALPGLFPSLFPSSLPVSLSLSPCSPPCLPFIHSSNISVCQTLY